MAISVGVKASKQAVSRNGLTKPVKAGLGSFLIAKNMLVCMLVASSMVTTKSHTDSGTQRWVLAS
jgi:redox-regulated HSP33 family molecular chaperone